MRRWHRIPTEGSILPATINILVWPCVKSMSWSLWALYRVLLGAFLGLGLGSDRNSFPSTLTHPQKKMIVKEFEFSRRSFVDKNKIKNIVKILVINKYIKIWEKYLSLVNLKKKQVTNICDWKIKKIQKFFVNI